jgi:hypothetical protein
MNVGLLIKKLNETINFPLSELWQLSNQEPHHLVRNLLSFIIKVIYKKASSARTDAGYSTRAASQLTTDNAVDCASSFESDIVNSTSNDDE